MTHSQEIIKYLQTVETATKADIYKNVKFGYYHNWQKHLGDVLSRMVNSKKIIREKKGVYRVLKITDRKDLQGTIFENA